MGVREPGAGGVGKSAAPGGAVVVGHGAIPPQRVPSVGAHSPDAPLSSSGCFPTGFPVRCPVRLSRFGGRREPLRRPAVAGRCLGRIVRVLRFWNAGTLTRRMRQKQSPPSSVQDLAPRVHPPAGFEPAGRTGSRATRRSWTRRTGPRSSRICPGAVSTSVGVFVGRILIASGASMPRTDRPKVAQSNPAAVGVPRAGDRRPAVARIEEGVRIGALRPVSGHRSPVSPSGRWVEPGLALPVAADAEDGSPGRCRIRPGAA